MNYNTSDKRHFPLKSDPLHLGNVLSYSINERIRISLYQSSGTDFYSTVPDSVFAG